VVVVVVVALFVVMHLQQLFAIAEHLYLLARTNLATNSFPHTLLREIICIVFGILGD